MCFHKPRPIPKHLLLVPEPPVYRRRTPLRWQTSSLLLTSVMLIGISITLRQPGWEMRSNNVALFEEGKERAIAKVTNDF